MKTMIVFIAFVLVFSSFLVFTADMTRYRQLQDQLKILAEECACGAALMTGDKDNHTAVVRENDAKLFVKKRLLITLSSTKIFDKGVISYDVTLPSKSSVKVTLTYTPDSGVHFFHFISMDTRKIVRSSVYEWVLQ